MAILLDTNIILRLMQPLAPEAAIAERALIGLRREGEILCLVSQNLFEFWAVATRPTTANGLGLTIEQASREMTEIKQLFIPLPEMPLQSEWESLVLAFRTSGKSSHDARLVAAMNVHGLSRILTFNTADFLRYDKLTVIDPRKIR